MDYRKFCKGLRYGWLISSLFLMSCSVNPATGRNEFTGLMPAQSEASIGASQHGEIIKQYGGLYRDVNVADYVTAIGRKVAKNTERADVTYQFFVLDSPIVNAFALPGGYVYITRGLLAVANDEAELAGVLGHEIGHITARHQAARYSQSVLTSLGTNILSAAVGSAALSQALDVGSNLYISSYSRDQESEADSLGIRYLRRAGYDPKAVSDFLSAMGQYQQAEAARNGEKADQPDFFATHPQTQTRVAAAYAEAAKYEKGPDIRNMSEYLRIIDGLTFGDSLDQGLVRGNVFYHPQMGFTFTAPRGYKIQNRPTQIVASRSGGALIVVDHGQMHSPDPSSYILSEWLEGKKAVTPEAITINGHRAATASFKATLNGTPVEIRLVAIEWGSGEVYRMQFAIPSDLGAQGVEDLKTTTYSFRELSRAEADSLHPQSIKVLTAAAGDTLQSFVARMQVDENPTDYFRALNGLKSGEGVVSGRQYKVVIQ